VPPDPRSDTIRASPYSQEAARNELTETLREREVAWNGQLATLTEEKTTLRERLEAMGAISEDQVTEWDGPHQGKQRIEPGAGGILQGRLITGQQSQLADAKRQLEILALDKEEARASASTLREELAQARQESTTLHELLDSLRRDLAQRDAELTDLKHASEELVLCRREIHSLREKCDGLSVEVKKLPYLEVGA
jgi:chromosome segregation ATPase